MAAISSRLNHHVEVAPAPPFVDVSYMIMSSQTTGCILDFSVDKTERKTPFHKTSNRHDICTHYTLCVPLYIKIKDSYIHNCSYNSVEVRVTPGPRIRALTRTKNNAYSLFISHEQNYRTSWPSCYACSTIISV